MSPPPFSLLLIDDHPLIRKGIIQLLALHPHITMVGEANDGIEGIALVETRKPDLILLDLNMAGQDGLSTLREIKQGHPNIKVVILTVSDNPQNIIEAFQNKADGYLLKSTDPEQIIHYLNRAADGEIVANPEVTEILDNSDQHGNSPPSGKLTRREEEVLQLIAEGLTNQEIGNRLGISIWTTKVHAKHILKKLGLASRNELIVWAIREGTGNSR